MLKTLTAVLCLAAFVVLMGACAIQDYLVPNYIDKRMGERTGAEMIGGPMPYTTIADAQRLGRELNFVSVEQREALLQEIEKSGRFDTFLAKGHELYMIDANALRETLFGSNGVFGGLMGLMGLGAGAVFIRRPGDLRPDEVEDV